MFLKGNKNFFILLVTIILSSGILYSKYEWRPLGPTGLNGTNGNVYAITQFNGKIIVAGGFSNAGGVNVNNIAQWDPVSKAWSPLGAGLNDTVYSLYVYNSQLYAAGAFLQSGTIFVNRIARWNGTVWRALGTGLDGEGYALYQFGTDLIVGGDFTNAGGISVNNIAKWRSTDSTWGDMSGGLTGSGDRVYALTVFNTELVVAGRFQTAGGSAQANNIARWNGTSWSSLGSGSNNGTNERIFALTVYNSELISGGKFTQAGGMVAYNIAKWNGSVWQNVGGYNAFWQNAEINALTVYNGNLIVGGGFHFCDTVYVSRVTAWDGVLWEKMSTGINDRVKTLYVFGSDLYAGGEFSVAGGRYENHVARWIDDSTVTITGQVKYADNNQPVMSGKVKVLRMDVNTREVIVVDTVHFTNGTYLLPGVVHDSLDRVIAFPDDELDFVPTYHPSAIDWRTAVPVVTYSSQVNIDIYVQRVLPEPNNPLAATIGGKVFLNTMGQNPPANRYPYWSDAVIYIKSDSSTYKRFAVSGTDRSYRTSVLNPGTYQVFVSRFGYTVAAQTVTLGSVNLDSVNFYLDSLNIIGLHNISSNVPDKFILKQNYPNPFNPSTTILFALPVDGFVELKIYDILGREIAVLVSEDLRKGDYKYIYDAGELASGIYFYTLRTGSFFETKKMILIK